MNTDNHENSSLVATGTERRHGREDEDQAKQLESYLRSSGLGLFHVILITVVGLITAADAVEVFSISFILPIADEDLDLSTAHKGWLSASIFIGMLIGSFVWGSLADAIGRKVTLVTAMLWNGLSGLVSAFSPNFTFFLVFRLASGIGVGGSIPVVFSYVSEFFTEKQTGPIVVITAAFWQPGIVFTAILAWALLGNKGTHSQISSYIGNLHFTTWRLFLIICTFPAFISSFSLLFLPESPAYLFNAKRMAKFTKVLRQIRKVNNLGLCCLKRTQNDEIPLIEMSESKDQNTSVDSKEEEYSINNCTLYVFTKTKQICSSSLAIFRMRYLRASVLLLLIWFTQMFGYYGMQLWFPEFFKRLYLDCLEYNSSDVLHNCTGNNTNLQFYQDTFFTALATLPGNIAGALLINIIGGRIQLVVGLLLSAMSVFSIWGVPSNHTAVVAVSCVFSAISLTVFGALEVVNTVYYDAEFRSTAFGVHSGVGRLGAILGIVMFGHLLDVNRGIPILIVASVLTVGALCALFLPQIYRLENRPLLERFLSHAGKKCKKFLKTTIN